MAYPSSLDELTDGVPSDGAAPTTALDNATYPHDDHHRALATAVEAIEAELGTDPSGAAASVKARIAATEAVANAAVPKSTVTTAGDLIYGTGNAAVSRLGIGSALQVLRTNAGATAPEWATVSSGGSFGLAPMIASGRYTPVNSIGSKGTDQLVQYIVHYSPFWIGESVTIDRLGLEVTGALASSVVRVGIYNASGGLPTTVVVDGGTVDSTGTGVLLTTVSTLLAPGMYFFAAVNQGSVYGSVSVRVSTGCTFALPQSSSTYVAQYGISQLKQSGVSGAFTTAGTITDGNANGAPICVVRGA